MGRDLLRRCGKLFLLAVFFCVVHVYLIDQIAGRIGSDAVFSAERARERVSGFAVTERQLDGMWENAGGDTARFCEYLAILFGTGEYCADWDSLEQRKKRVLAVKGEEYEETLRLVCQIFSDLSVFPVGRIRNQPKEQVAFCDTYHEARKFGGDRLHEGTDIFPTLEKRGLYPVKSVSDGVVEKIGWLKLGGYRVGIRSSGGAYFYYAHLAEYAEGLKEGDAVTAGTLLGYMGDTGYSETEGETGNFAVHLHFGIYLEDADGEEFAVNSYPALLFLWKYGVNEFTRISRMEDGQVTNFALGGCEVWLHGINSGKHA